MPMHTFKVDPQNDKTRLDVFLAECLPDAPSRTFVQKLIAAGQVSVNQKPAKAHLKLATDDEVVVQEFKILSRQSLKAEDIPLDVVYEDDRILLINKPSGLLVHPVNAQNQSGTLVNALLHHCRKLSKADEDLRPGIVHRLDRETSGLLLVAKDDKTHVFLSKQFQEHQIYKKYLALVEGDVQFDEGVVDVALGRDRRFYDRKRVSYEDDAKEAQTFYKVVKHFKGRTLIALFPKTGRTHQLRVHMAHLGHPILGDDKYGKRKSFPRLALHAQAIGFMHPSMQRFIEFSTRPPAEFLAD